MPNVTPICNQVATNNEALIEKFIHFLLKFVIIFTFIFMFMYLNLLSICSSTPYNKISLCLCECDGFFVNSEEP